MSAKPPSEEDEILHINFDESITHPKTAEQKNQTNTNTESAADLQDIWKTLHHEKSERLTLNDMFSFLNKTNKLYNTLSENDRKISPTEASFDKSPEQKNSVPFFKATAEETLEQMILGYLFETAEIVYKNMDKKGLITLHRQELSNKAKDPNNFLQAIDKAALSSFEDLFWDKISHILMKVLESALKIIAADFKSDEAIFDSFCKKWPLANLTALARSQIRSINMLNNLCQARDGKFLRYFKSENTPFKLFKGGQCTGLFVSWASKLYQKPKSQQTSDIMTGLSRFLQILKSEKIPEYWPFKDILLGESVYNMETHKLQYNPNPAFTRQVRYAKTLPTTEDMKGESIVKLADSLFSKENKVSIVAIYLNTTNLWKFQPHMLGLAKIRLNDKESFRFLEPELGEFEFNKLEDVAEFLNLYFSLPGFHYFNKHCSASLCNTDISLNVDRSAEIKQTREAKEIKEQQEKPPETPSKNKPLSWTTLVKPKYVSRDTTKSRQIP